MLHADLKNKVRQVWDEDLERSEDYLTSTFFGILNYLPTDLILKALLPDIRSSNSDAYHHRFEFWPRYNQDFYWQGQTVQKSTEPDLVIHTQTALTIVEAKYTTRLGSDETQLPRQLLLACHLAQEHNLPIFNLAVTADNTDPLPNLIGSIQQWCDQISSDVSRSIGMARANLQEQTKRLSWVSWSEITKRIESTATACSFPVVPYILNDLKQVCQLRNLSPFEGFSSSEKVIADLAWSFKGIEVRKDRFFMPQIPIYTDLRWQLQRHPRSLFFDPKVSVDRTRIWSLR